ncbi:MAG: PEP-CTERM sorting domain-containing protein [Bryobacteraceae bacterium]
MTMKRVSEVIVIMAALFVMSVTAGASTIVYDTSDSPLTMFTSGGLVLDSTGGAAATLTYDPLADTSVGTPSNINLGDFDLVCPTCGTQASGLGTAFGAFTLDLVVTDDTDHATGEFVGTSSGGSVWSDVSQISITWSPLQVGPGMTDALTGDFGTTLFTISSPTLIVAPNSGAGVTTLEGTVNAVSVAGVPEPATMAMVGGAFVGLAALARKRRRRT